MKKKIYKTPTVKVKYIGTDDLLKVGSDGTENTTTAPTDDDFDAGAKKSIWSSFDNDEK